MYAPNSSLEQNKFFQDMNNYVREKTILLGDFNSVTQPCDWQSKCLDATSNNLSQSLSDHGLFEPPGCQHHIFTYHHPSIISCKSCLDHIYLNFDMKGLRGYSHHVSFSDHYLVGTFITLDEDRGSQLWCMPNDALLCPETIQQIQLVLDNFDSKMLVNSWELIKVKV